MTRLGDIWRVLITIMARKANGFYDEVIKALHGADPLLILGPGEAKGEFQKRLQNKHFPAKIVDVATADKMTDRQVAAKVREHFEVSESPWEQHIRRPRF